MTYAINEKLYENIKIICLNGFDNEAKPLQLMEKVWENFDFPMHCPEHHFLIPAVLLTVYRRLKNDDKEILGKDLIIAEERAKNILAGFCGWYGVCGAAVGSGIFLSLLTDTSPYSTEKWALANRLTSECLRDIAALGGPRCCKRTCFATLEATMKFMKNKMNLDLGEMPDIRCSYSENNLECRKESCPYYFRPIDSSPMIALGDMSNKNTKFHL